MIWRLPIIFILTVSSTFAADINLVFTYGSEKEKWIESCTKDFNAQFKQTRQGNRIVVEAIPMGSGECLQEIIENKRQVHLVSPASTVTLDLYNGRAGSPLVGQTQKLVLSPVVIAMWKPMAEALGWGQQPVGWAEVIDMAKRPDGWAHYDFPKWGKFKFGHTHPEFSNSGIQAMVAMAYAGVGKTQNLTIGDVDRPATGQFMREIQQSIVHYGSSTGFFGRKMFKSGPEYLSAAVLYENMVIESYSTNPKPALPVVAIYPKEGTFWSDHPIGIVQRPYVGPEEQEAAKTYVLFLQARPQQEKALLYGFRPSDTTIALGAPFDAAHGVDSREPKALLQVPTRDVIEQILGLWKREKKQANVILAIDVSGSMNEEKRLERARAGAVRVVEMLGDDDRLSLLTFGTEVQWKFQDKPVRATRDEAIKTIQALRALGRTALYDGVSTAYEYSKSVATGKVIPAVVVLTDGEDTTSKIKLSGLKEQLQFDPDRRPTLVFTIGYGNEANEKVLKDIADSTQAKFYKGTPENIQKILEDNAAFFGSGGGNQGN